MGGLLRELRESQGLSQRELAKKLDRTQAFVWKVEQGIQHLDIPTLIDVSRCLSVSASQLIAILEEPTNWPNGSSQAIGHLGKVSSK